MPGAWCARSRACSVVNTRVSHYGHTGNARHSPRNGFTAYFELSPVIGLFCHRHQRIESANLTPASRRQDHTTSPSASAPFVKGASASIASRLTFVTIAKRPSGRRDGAIIALIWGSCETEYFLRAIWTPQITLKHFSNLPFTLKSFLMLSSRQKEAASQKMVT
jgi:hypothetical protein